MGKAVPLTTATEAKGRSSSTRSSSDYQWNPVDFANRSTLERSARLLWPLEHGSQPLLSLAKGRYLATRAGSPATAERCGWRDRLGQALRRWHHYSSASACGWGKTGKPNQEPLGKNPVAFITNLLFH